MAIPFFLIPIIAGLLAQLSKALFNPANYGPAHLRQHLPHYGGMPSAHSSFAFSLATVVFLVDGMYSATFVIAMAIVIFILDDALRLRIFLGRQGEAVNKLLEQLPPEERKSLPFIEKRLGHTWQEVLAGACFGIGATALLWWLFY